MWKCRKHNSACTAGVALEALKGVLRVSELATIDNRGIPPEHPHPSDPVRVTMWGNRVGKPASASGVARLFIVLHAAQAITAQKPVHRAIALTVHIP